MHDEAQYYTPQRVRYWLDRYPALAIAVQYGTGLGRGDLCSDAGRIEAPPVFAVRASPRDGVRQGVRHQQHTA